MLCFPLRSVRVTYQVVKWCCSKDRDAYVWTVKHKPSQLAQYDQPHPHSAYPAFPLSLPFLCHPSIHPSTHPSNYHPTCADSAERMTW